MDNKFIGFVEKWPNWLRYTISIPFFWISYILTIIFLKFARGWYTMDDSEIVYIISEILIEPIAIGFALYIFYEIVPKNKFKITLVYSVIVSLIVITAFVMIILYRDGYTSLSFWQNIISRIIDIIVISQLNVQFFKEEYNIKAKNKIELEEVVNEV